MRSRGALVALALLGAAALSLLAVSAGTGPPGSGEAVDDATASHMADGVEDTLGELGVPYRREERASARGVADEAASVLEDRRARGDSLVVRSGYLDMFGGAWGCVLQGSGWVEVCLVSEDGDGEGSSVVTWRMLASDLAGLAGE